MPVGRRNHNAGVGNDLRRKSKFLSPILAESSMLRCYLLYMREDPVAFIRGYQYEGTYYYEEIGFDKDFRHLEPGTGLNFFVLQDLFSHDKPQRLDFGFGENDYKRKYWCVEGRFEGRLAAKWAGIGGEGCQWRRFGGC